MLNKTNRKKKMMMEAVAFCTERLVRIYAKHVEQKYFRSKGKQAAFRYDLVKKEKGEELAKCTICRKKEVVIDKRIKAVELVKLWTGGSTKKHENFTGAFLFLFFILFYYVCFSSPSRWSTMPSAALR